MRSKKTISFAICLLAIICLSVQGQAQTPPPYVPNVIPPSPNAATLMKFTDVPVSPYTGTADVSVPIYTIQAKGMSIPISLNYHTGGIKLKEESGWVGLGWALSAGGMISRTVNDKDDFHSGYFGSVVPIVPGDLASYQPSVCTSPLAINKYDFAFYGGYKVYFTSGMVDYTMAFYTPAYPLDLQPDTYTYNFLGHSGKFIMTNDRHVVLERQDNIKIELLNTPGQDNYTFLVTDDAGNKYYFNDTETSSPLSGLNPALSTWHLSKVVTQQNDVVKFTYLNDGTATTVEHEQNQTVRTFCKMQGTYWGDDGGLNYSNVILQSIDFTDGQVQFSFDSNREDLLGGRKLNAVKVYSKSTAGLKFIKEHDLYYSYFMPVTAAASKREMERLRLDSVKEVSGAVSVRPYRFNYNVYSTNGSTDFLAKHAFSIDHWGYFNAKSNTVLIPSLNTIYGGQFGIAPYYYSYTGANRESDSSAMQNFSLQQVTYPTGGKTMFEFSPNYYDQVKSIVGITEYPQAALVQKDTIIQVTASGTTNGVIDFSQISQVIQPPVSGTNAIFNIAFVANSGSGWPSSIRNSFGKLYVNVNGNIVDISSSSLSCPPGSQACSVSVPLAVALATPADFHWSVYVDPTVTSTLSLVHIDVSFQALQSVVNSHSGVSANSLSVMAGGLRINSVTDYSDATTVAKKRVWKYNYGSAGQYSYGRLMSFPSYLRLEPDTKGPTDDQTCWSLTAFSSSKTALSSVIQGNIVGYTRVEEYTVDPTTSANTGKTVYDYFNSPDSTVNYNGFRMPGISNMGNHLNGSLLSKKEYRNTGGNYFKVHETYNYFHTANRIVYYVPKYQSGWSPGQSQGGTCGDGDDTHHVPNVVFAYFYPAIKSERVLQDSTREVVYDQGDTTKFQLTSNKSYYDNPVHYQLTRSVMTDSKGNRHVSRVTYPQDYLSGASTGNSMLDTLIRRNMVSTSIEKRDSLYYFGSSTGYVTGAVLSKYRQLASGTVVSDKLYKLELLKPVTDFMPMAVSGGALTQDSRYRQLISFDAYDGKNNIAQYSVTGQLPVSILWDYRGASPIAQVKNADTLSMAYTSFEAEGSGHWILASALRDSLTATISGIKSYSLSNGAISRSGLTSANTYIVSYWTKSATPLSITGTVSGYPVNGIATRGWYYHEHRVTGVTSVSISGTGNIDELRLYPLNAQMQSFTYTPLVGVSGTVDARNGLSFYDYDALQRLLGVRDQDGNILKSYNYNYRP